jgi:hypothetical protein
VELAIVSNNDTAQAAQEEAALVADAVIAAVKGVSSKMRMQMTIP